MGFIKGFETKNFKEKKICKVKNGLKSVRL